MLKIAPYAGFSTHGVAGVYKEGREKRLVHFCRLSIWGPKIGHSSLYTPAENQNRQKF